MKHNTKTWLFLPILIFAGLCAFSLSHKSLVEEKPECGLRECCRKMKAEPTCNIKASGTEFGVFDAGSRLFTAKS